MSRPVYLALFLGAIALPGAAEQASPVDVAAAKAAGLVRLADTFPAEVPDVAFGDLDGAEHRLSDWQGQALLVNFWATWCAPCREEMPSLDALQQAEGGEDFQVLTVAAGRNPPEAMRKFFAEEGIESLPLLTDARMELARNMGVVGLPVTVLIDRQGREVARLNGEADWASEAARALITDLKAN